MNGCGSWIRRVALHHTTRICSATHGLAPMRLALSFHRASTSLKWIYPSRLMQPGLSPEDPTAPGNMMDPWQHWTLPRQVLRLVVMRISDGFFPPRRVWWYAQDTAWWW